MVNKCDDCEHNVCYEIGFQQGIDDVQGFYMGNCVRCGTTKSMKEYHVIKGILYDGKKVYVK